MLETVAKLGVLCGSAHHAWLEPPHPLEALQHKLTETSIEGDLGVIG